MEHQKETSSSVMGRQNESESTESGDNSLKEDEDEHSTSEDRLEDEHSTSEDRLENEHSISEDMPEDEHSISEDMPEDEHSISEDRLEDEHSISEDRLEDEHSISEDRLEDEHSISEDRLSCSSSVSSASGIESAITDFSVEEKHESGSMSNDQEEQDDTLETNQSGASALESPPVQTMERPVSPSGYRIPSYVFARNKSTNPEWSAASNESLFSIHTGNMSFTREQFNWLLNPSEFSSYVPGDVRKSGELPPPSPKHVSKARAPKLIDLPKSDERIAQQREEPHIHTPIPGEEIIAAHFKTSSSAAPPPPPPPPPPRKEDDFHVLNQLHVTEASDLVANKGKKDNVGVENKEKRSSASNTSDDIPLNNCVSHHSDASGQSFAFPVLAEIGRDKSVSSGQSHVRPDVRKNSLANDQEPTKSPKQTTEAAPQSSSSWLPSCFSCCSCC